MRNQLLGNRYRIVDLIGEGGMAYVYVAIDEKLGRRVAVKVLHEHMERNPDIRLRFQAEAQAISAFDHPNIVKIYDFSGDQVGRLWIVTEVIHGKNVAQYLQGASGGWLHPVIAACIVREICKALAMAHEHGIVHRDIKPENVMLTFDGRVILMDFGIAKDLGKSSVTVTGTFMGSPSYMSPEQIRGRDVDWRSDLYSLSVLFYEIVTGRLPFIGHTTHDVVLKIMEANYTHPRYLVPGLPLPLNDLIVQGMAKTAAERPQSANDYGSAIDSALYALGFDESHIELERYFRDRDAYNTRLQAAKTYAAPPPMPPQRQRVPTPAPRLQASAAPKKLATQPPAPQSQAQPSPVYRANQPTPRPQSGIPAKPAATQYLAATPPRPVPRVAAASARAQQRPVMRTSGAPTSNQSWIGYIFGSLLVGLTCTISFWGFWMTQTRFSPRNRPTTVHDNDPWIDNARDKSKTARSTTHPRRDGTPAKIVVATPTEVLLTTPSAPQPHGVYPPRRADNRIPPASKKPTKRPDSGTETVKGEGNKAELVATPVGSSSTKANNEPDAKIIKKPVFTSESPTPAEPQPSPAAVVAPPSDKPEPVKHVDKSDKDNRPERDPHTDKETHPDKTASTTDHAEKPDAKAGTHGKGRLIVSSQPASEIYVDGRRLGTTIDNTADSGPLALAAGHHLLELRRSGYSPQRRHFDLATDETLNLPKISLEAAGTPSTAQTVGLTVRTNADPAQVTVRNLATNATQIFTMRGNTKQLQLTPGRYYLRVERSGEVKERELNLTGTETQLTFSAEFKKAE